MKQIHWMLLLLIGFVLGIFIIVGCAANVVEESPSPKEEITQQEATKVEDEPVVKQEQIKQVAEDCDALRSELKALQAKYEALQSENSELNAKLNTLLADYDELTTRYNNLLEGTPDITESDLEQAIFKTINKGRKDSGLDELEWTDGFYEWAKEHSDYLATKNLAEESDKSYWQGVFRAAGYSSLDRLTKAAWMVWKENTTFEMNFLNQQAQFGTVAVSKSGGIFYITYFAHNQK